MRALILAGGKGTRLHPVTLETPKPLLTVQKRPILSHLVDLFLKYGISDIGISINAEHQEDFDWWYRRWHDTAPLRFFEEDEALGTFGAVMNAEDFIREEDFFVTNGDELKRLDLTAMRQFHQAHDGPATIALVEHDRPQDYGVAEMDGDRIVRFLEKPKKPPTNLISSGLYLFTPEVLDYYENDKPAFAMLEQDLFPRLAQEGKLYGFPFQGQWYDTGTLERWQKAIEEWNG